MTTPTLPPTTRIAFIGGGNMASAIIGGLIRQGLPATQVMVVEPFEATRVLLKSQHGVQAHPAPGPFLADADLIVWAVKPQSFREAAAPVAPLTGRALQLSVMAGIRAADIAAASGSARIVRCMPNTPALVGRGMTGLFDAAGAAADRQLAETVIRTTGDVLWVEREEQLDAVTALSGSGPAYFFALVEALEDAAVAQGLPRATARALAAQTCLGAGRMLTEGGEDPAELRRRVTSPGGTTQAALESFGADGLPRIVARAVAAATRRGAELAAELDAQRAIRQGAELAAKI